MNSNPISCDVSFTTKTAYGAQFRTYDDSILAKSMFRKTRIPLDAGGSAWKENDGSDDHGDEENISRDDDDGTNCLKCEGVGILRDLLRSKQRIDQSSIIL